MNNLICYIKHCCTVGNNLLYKGCLLKLSCSGMGGFFTFSSDLSGRGCDKLGRFVFLVISNLVILNARSNVPYALYTPNESFDMYLNILEL